MRDERLAVLSAGAAPCSPVHNLSELTAHPYTAASGLVLEYHAAPRGMLNAGRKIVGANTWFDMNKRGTIRVMFKKEPRKCSPTPLFSSASVS